MLCAKQFFFLLTFLAVLSFKEVVQLLKDLFVKEIWPPFLCFGTWLSSWLAVLRYNCFRPRNRALKLRIFKGIEFRITRINPKQHLTSLLISHASTGRFSPNFQKRCYRDKQRATEMKRCAEKIPTTKS